MTSMLHYSVIHDGVVAASISSVGVCELVCAVYSNYRVVVGVHISEGRQQEK